METIMRELSYGLGDSEHLIQVIVRLLAAAVLGGVIGFERERLGKAAGLRTHILVALGTCVFVVACKSAGMGSDAMSRVIQGIVTGIGFLGAGTILKLDEKRDIKGLTTSAGIWMTSAIGIAVGLGALGVAIISTILALIVLSVVRRMERSLIPEIAKEKDP